MKVDSEVLVLDVEVGVEVPDVGLAELKRTALAAGCYLKESGTGLGIFTVAAMHLPSLSKPRPVRAPFRTYSTSPVSE